MMYVLKAAYASVFLVHFTPPSLQVAERYQITLFPIVVECYRYSHGQKRVEEVMQRKCVTSDYR